MAIFGSLPTDGWTADPNTWTYASSTSFTVSGIDVTSQFTPGTKLKLTNSSLKYFYVTSSSFSTNTTVNITGGSDYSLANAAISGNYYSYQSSPQGFPDWFNYSPSWTGYSAAPSSGIVRFTVKGRTVFYNLQASTNGTSNATNNAVSLPITASSISGGGWRGVGTGVNSGSALSGGTEYDFGASATTATLYSSTAAGSWTASGGKNWRGVIIYEI